jgi:hypothetical protein
MKHEQTASAEALPNAARIQRVEGEVALDNGNSGNAQNDQWIAATANQPFSVGDRIYTRDNSRASLAFTRRWTFFRLATSVHNSHCGMAQQCLTSVT